MIDGSTRVFAILGDPVAHSLSPAMQNAAFRVLGLQAAYVPSRCTPDDLPGLLRALSRAGGGGNVTVPHKEPAARRGRSSQPAAERLGACNTFWGEDGASVGDNTDVAGRARRARRPGGAAGRLAGRSAPAAARARRSGRRGSVAWRSR